MAPGNKLAMLGNLPHKDRSLNWRTSYLLLSSVRPRAHTQPGTGKIIYTFWGIQLTFWRGISISGTRLHRRREEEQGRTTTGQCMLFHSKSPGAVADRNPEDLGRGFGKDCPGVGTTNNTSYCHSQFFSNTGTLPYIGCSCLPVVGLLRQSFRISLCLYPSDPVTEPQRATLRRRGHAPRT
ncbi:hypothetical protein VTI28DRAFT_7338 [Corynascus sepedonium]